MTKNLIKILIILFFNVFNYCLVDTSVYKVPINNIRGPGSHNHLFSHPPINFKPSSEHLCLVKNKLLKCPYVTTRSSSNHFNSVEKERLLLHNIYLINSYNSGIRTTNKMYPVHVSLNTPPLLPPSTLLNILPYQQKRTAIFSNNSYTNQLLKPTTIVHPSAVESKLPYQKQSSFEQFERTLDIFEREFYKVTFGKLTSICPQGRQINGMSFVQSAFFLQLSLMALSLEVDSQTRTEIKKIIGFQASYMETGKIIRDLMSPLPVDSEKLRFRYASRLVLWPGIKLTPQFQAGAPTSLRLHIDFFKGTESPEEIYTILNEKIESDSGGAIRDTFDEDDFFEGVTAILMTTVYFRARWRVAPTVLNGTWPFYDADDSLQRTVQMIKLNDIMGYADIKEWNAQVLEIPYASPELSLLMIVPRAVSLRRLTDHVTGTSIKKITSLMRQTRLSVILPLYTLRMTLLVPNKLQAMGISQLFNVSASEPDALRLSHMVQRLMFWSEAGRTAYKDDGLPCQFDCLKQRIILTQ